MSFKQWWLNFVSANDSTQPAQINVIFEHRLCRVFWAHLSELCKVSMDFSLVILLLNYCDYFYIIFRVIIVVMMAMITGRFLKHVNFTEHNALHTVCVITFLNTVIMWLLEISLACQLHGAQHTSWNIMHFMEHNALHNIYGNTLLIQLSVSLSSLFFQSPWGRLNWAYFGRLCPTVWRWTQLHFAKSWWPVSRKSLYASGTAAPLLSRGKLRPSLWVSV